MADKQKRNTEYQTLVAKAIEKFGLAADFQFCGLQKKLMKKLYELKKPTELFALCMEFDLTPKELTDVIAPLEAEDLVKGFSENAVELTDRGLKLITRTKEEKKAEKKFRQFIKCLDASELIEFFNLCDSFAYDQEFPDFVKLLTASKEKAQKKAEEKAKAEMAKAEEIAKAEIAKAEKEAKKAEKEAKKAEQEKCCEQPAAPVKRRRGRPRKNPIEQPVEQ